jgi:hypothetical protein
MTDCRFRPFGPGRARPEMTSTLDFFTLICCSLAVGIFCLSLAVQKLCDFFRLPLKMPFEKLREGIVPCKVEIVDIDGSIDYWHQEGARGR